jgi:single-strand DNA-binding protein
MLPLKATEEDAVNVVSLVGNLATDVEVRELDQERKVGNFRLALDRFSKDGGADFVSVTVWNKQADSCGRYLTKGQKVAIHGRLRSRSWDDADGNRRSALEVVAHHVEFLSPPQDRADTPFAEVAAA